MRELGKQLGITVVGLLFTLFPTWESRAETPLSADNQLRPEIEVYEAVLQRWLGGSPKNVLVDERLDAAPTVSDKELSDCLRGVKFRSSSASVMDSLRSATFRLRGIRIIDGAKWHAADQQLQAGLGRGEVREADLERAFDHGLTSFSRIQFDQDKRLALVTFSFVCAELCGSGSTLLMQKAQHGWKVIRQCRGWVS